MPKNSVKEDNSSFQHDKHHEEGNGSPQHDKHHEEQPSKSSEVVQATIPEDKPETGHLSSSSCPKTTGEAFIGEGAFGIEFCSGTAGLTAQLRLHRLPASFGVDHKIKAGAKAPVCKLDLTEETAVELALTWVRHPQCKYLHLGVPCGTCSRAREIVLNESAPRPLRSETKPDGLDGLSTQETERVRLANAVYSAACRLILCAEENKKFWTLEQPSRSLFWNTSFWKCIMAHTDPYYATFHTCMYGGLRAKSTTIAANFPEILELSVECDRQHAHLPWGKTAQGFATAEEVEYPLQLCKEWALIIQNLIPETTEKRVNLSSPDKRARALTFKQTKKSLAFMPEYSTVASARFTNYMPAFKAGDKIKAKMLDDENNVLPYASRILRVTLKHPKGGRVKFESEKSADCFYEVAFGKPWSEEEFITEAHRRGHPAHLFQALSSSMVQAVDANVNLKPAEIISHRAKWLKKWMARAVELKGSEEKLHAKMPLERRLILAKKKILLLREILKDEGYPDISLCDDLTNGFPLVGLCGESDALPPDFQPATMSVPDLESTAERCNKSILHSTKGSGDELVDAELWHKTLEEEKKGWLRRLEEIPLDGGRISRRFAVVQSSKVRPIDNYSESQVNDAATITNKCTVDGVDTIAALVSSFIKSLNQAGRSSSILGRAFDLKAAYRQLSVSDDSLKWARIAAYDPHRKTTVCFQQFTMPFGAKASVVAFLRCARMLQWLSHKLLIVSSCYFDDFVVMAPDNLAKSTEETFQLLLDLLGWDFDRDGDKSGKMGAVVAALGVQVDLSQSSSGLVKVENTEKRKLELSRTIKEVLQSGKLSKGDAASLRGRLGFAEGQLFGRVTRQLLNDLHIHSQRPPRGMSLGEDTRASLSIVESRLLSARPRVVDMRSSEVLFIYTDASFDSEDKRGGVGGVLFDASGCVSNWFGGEVESTTYELLMSEDQKHAIGEMETFAVLIAFNLWSKLVTSKHLVLFLDNEGCRHLILRGFSGNKNISKLVHEIAKEEEKASCFPWYARVPSEANIADSSSRNKKHQLLEESKRDPLPNLGKLIKSCVRTIE